MKLPWNKNQTVDVAKLTEEITGKVEAKLKEEIQNREKYYLNFASVKSDDDSNQGRDFKVKQSWDMWESNPIAETAIEYRVAYILGKGLQYSCEVPELKEKLDAFWKENDLQMGHFDLVRSLKLDGEVFLYMPKIVLGQIPSMIAFDSTEIKYIARDPKDFRKIAYYHRYYKKIVYPPITENAPSSMLSPIWVDENIPAEDMIHFKIGGLLNLSRGRGVLYRIVDHLKDYNKWLKDRVKINRVKSAFAWILKLATDNTTDVDTWQTKLNNFAKYDKDGGTIDSIPTGQPVVLGKSMDMQAVNANVNASGSVEDGRAIKLMACAGTRLPEFMLGDGQNSNLASSTSQKSPMIKSMEVEQEQVRILFKMIFDKVIDLLIASLDLNETYPVVTATLPDGSNVIEELPTKECYDLIFPEIATSDVATLALPVAKLVDDQILSRETSCTLLGYDWEQEKERIKAEKEAGYVSAPPPSPFGAQSFQSTLSAKELGLTESMSPEHLKKVKELNLNCQTELKKNVDRYKEALLKGDPLARENFITIHQQIVRKYLDISSKEAYASKVSETIK